MHAHLVCIGRPPWVVTTVVGQYTDRLAMWLAISALMTPQ